MLSPSTKGLPVHVPGPGSGHPSVPRIPPSLVTVVPASDLRTEAGSAFESPPRRADRGCFRGLLQARAENEHVHSEGPDTSCPGDPLERRLPRQTCPSRPRLWSSKGTQPGPSPGGLRPESDGAQLGLKDRVCHSGLPLLL